MPKPGPVPEQEAYKMMFGIYTNHVSTDDMGLDMEAAAEPAEEAIRRLSRPGDDEYRMAVISAIALCDAVADNLSGSFVLPSLEEPSLYTAQQDGTSHEERPTRYLFVSDAEGGLL